MHGVDIFRVSIKCVAKAHVCEPRLNARISAWFPRPITPAKAATNGVFSHDDIKHRNLIFIVKAITKSLMQ